MSISVAFGTDIDTTFKGQPLKLAPLTLYELARLENPYIEYRLKQTAVDTSVLSKDEQRKAFDEVREERVLLAEDISPILRWVVLNAEGQAASVKMCFDVNHPGVMSERDVTIWIKENPVNFERWLVVSGVIPDPTTPSRQTDSKTETAEEMPITASASTT